MDTALKVVEIQPRGSSGKSVFKIEGELESILSQAKDNPVCIIVATGASRLGKSCYLSYVVKYLAHLENHVTAHPPAWLDPSCKDPLSEVFPFKNSVDRQTTGFWIWPRPFNIRTEDDRTLSVFLMDTQGLLDKSGAGDWASIFGLALITSNILLHNLHFNPKEEDLSFMETFLQYGLMVQGNTPSDPEGDGYDDQPFQSLYCLVRDWNKPEMYLYGSIGGSRYKQYLFGTDNPDLSLEGKRRRQNINRCFQNISCYLMPHPGDKALSNSFQGTNADLQPEFLEHLQKSIESLCSPANLKAKRIAGRIAKYPDIMNIFRESIKVINSETTPQAQNYLEATHLTLCTKAKEEAIAFLKESFEQPNSSSCVDLLDESKLNEKFRNISYKATSRFRQQVATFPPPIRNQFEKSLVDDIKSVHTEIISQWLGFKQIAIEKLLRQAEQTFSEYIVSYREKHSYSHIMPFPEQELENLLKEARSHAVRSFNSEPQLQSEKFAKEFTAALKPSLVALCGRERKANKSLCDHNTATINPVLESLLSKYREVFQEKMSRKQFLSDNKMHELDVEAQQACVKKLVKLEIGNPVFREYHTLLKSRLSKETSKEFQALLHKQKEKNHFTLSQLDVHLRNTKEAAFKEIHEWHATKPGNLGKLCEKYEDIKLSSTARFLRAAPAIDRNILDSYVARINDFIDQETEKIMQKESENVSRLHAQLAKEQELLLQAFETCLLAETKAGKFDPKQLLLFGTTKSQEMLKSFRSFLTSLQCSKEEAKSYSVELQKKLDKNLEQLVNDYAEALKEEVENAIAESEQYLQLYLRKIDESLGSPEEIVKLHNTARDATLHSFNSTSKKYSPKAVEEATIQLKARIENRFKEERGRITEKRLQLHEEIGNLIQNTVDHYKHQMHEISKQDYLDESMLERNHATLLESGRNQLSHHMTSMGILPDDSQIWLERWKESVEMEFVNSLQEFTERKEQTESNNVNEALETATSLFLTRIRGMIQNAKFNDEEKWLRDSITELIGASTQKLLKDLQDRGISLTNEEVKETKNALARNISSYTQELKETFSTTIATKKQDLADWVAAAETDYKVTLQTAADELLCQSDEALGPVGESTEDRIKRDFSANFGTFLDEVSLANYSLRLATKFRTIDADVIEIYTRKFTKLEELIQRFEEKLEQEVNETDDPDWAELKTKLLTYCSELQTELEPLCNFRCQDNQESFFTDFKNICITKVDAMQNAYRRSEPDPVLLQNVLENICQQYNSEMSAAMPSGTFLPIEELAALHSRVLASVDVKLKQNILIKVTKRVRERFTQRMQTCYEKIVLENLKNAPPSELAIGIDLGTTFSCVSIWENGDARTLLNNEGERVTPSYVLVRNGAFTVGTPAKSTVAGHPESTIYGIKRLIGRKYNDIKIQENIRKWPFRVYQDTASDDPLIEVEGERYSAVDISAEILKKLKRDAENVMGRSIKKAVITVPAYFNNEQRECTKIAGEKADFEVMELLNEPTAAAVAYSRDYSPDKEKKVLVFDLGGGTFDVAVLTVNGHTVDVHAVGGDTHLGGEDFDNRLMEHCMTEFMNDNPQVFSRTRTETFKGQELRCRRRLKQECEKAKHILSAQEDVSLEIAGLFVDVESGGIAIDLSVSVSKQEFEDMNRDLFQRTIDLLDETLRSKNVRADEIDDVLLIGGSTRIPKIRELLQDYFDGKTLHMGMDASEAVARGAAIMAAVRNGCDQLNITLRDVTPLKIGIRTEGGKFSTLIDRNSKYGTSKTKVYHTATDDQTSVDIQVFEGEDSRADKNHMLGHFRLHGIPPAPKGEQEIEVTMTVDNNGILKVTAETDLEDGGLKKELVIEAYKKYTKDNREFLEP